MTLRIISIFAVTITIGPSLAYGSPACMTESEALAKFPKATHLYMRQNCWSDRRLRPCIRGDSHPTLTRPCIRGDPRSQQRLRRFLHDPKSLTPAPTQKRNVNIRHVSREKIRRNPLRLVFREQL